MITGKKQVAQAIYYVSATGNQRQLNICATFFNLQRGRDSVEKCCKICAKF